jgi:hypothetical protein
VRGADRSSLELARKRGGLVAVSWRRGGLSGQTFPVGSAVRTPFRMAGAAETRSVTGKVGVFSALRYEISHDSSFGYTKSISCTMD